MKACSGPNTEQRPGSTEKHRLRPLPRGSSQLVQETGEQLISTKPQQPALGASMSPLCWPKRGPLSVPFLVPNLTLTTAADQACSAEQVQLSTGHIPWDPASR